MAPRCGKKRRKIRNPMPVWLPLPRMGLQNVNMPGSPYYMPISPDMYLPPWTLPPSYFTKPLCHCANEDFCTTSNCRNSTECIKMRPMFCPRGIRNGKTSDINQNTARDEQENNDYEETSSSSDICSACGAPPRGLRTLSKQSNMRQDNQPRPNHTSQFIRTQDSFTSSHNLEEVSERLGSANSERKNIPIIRKRMVSREMDITTESGISSPEIALSNNYRNGYINTSCQTSPSRRNSSISTLKNNHVNMPRSNISSSESTSIDAQDLENSLDRSVPIPSNIIYKTPKNVAKNEFGCSSCADENISPDNYLQNHPTSSKTNVMRKELIGINEKLTTDIHIDQLPDQLSSARNRKANKYSGCCFTGSDRSCKTNNKIDAMTNPTMEIPYNDMTKSRKKSKCECSTNTPSKSSSSKLSECKCSSTKISSKLSDCKCSSTKISYKDKDTSRCRKKSKCECSSNKTAHKHSSKTHKFTECVCSTKKNSQKMECSCPSTDVLPKAFSGSENASAKGLYSAEGYVPSAYSPTCKKSNKSSKDITSVNANNVKQSSCQCKFPPAYEHLSCTGNFNNCRCTNND